MAENSYLLFLVFMPTAIMRWFCLSAHQVTTMGKNQTETRLRLPCVLCGLSHTSPNTALNLQSKPIFLTSEFSLINVSRFQRHGCHPYIFLFTSFPALNSVLMHMSHSELTPCHFLSSLTPWRQESKAAAFV